MKRLGTYYGSRNAASSMRAGGRPARQNCAMDTSPGIPPAGKSNPPLTIGLPRPPGLAWAASLLDAATGLHALEQYYRVRPAVPTPPAFVRYLLNAFLHTHRLPPVTTTEG